MTLEKSRKKAFWRISFGTTKKFYDVEGCEIDARLDMAHAGVSAE